MTTLDFLKECTTAIEFRDMVSRQCNRARTVYESDSATVQKVFDTYVGLITLAYELKLEMPSDIYSYSGKQLVDFIHKNLMERIK